MCSTWLSQRQVQGMPPYFSPLLLWSWTSDLGCVSCWPAVRWGHCLRNAKLLFTTLESLITEHTRTSPTGSVGMKGSWHYVVWALAHGLAVSPVLVGVVDILLSKAKRFDIHGYNIIHIHVRSQLVGEVRVTQVVDNMWDHMGRVSVNISATGGSKEEREYLVAEHSSWEVVAGKSQSL